MFDSKKDAEYFLRLCGGFVCGKCGKGIDHHTIVPGKQRRSKCYEVVCN